MNIQKGTKIPSNIGRPALSALHSSGYVLLEQIAKLSEKELLAIHGVGPKAVRLLREALKASEIDSTL